MTVLDSDVLGRTPETGPAARRVTLDVGVVGALKGAFGLAILTAVFEAARATELLPTASVPSSAGIARAIGQGLAGGALAQGLGWTALAWLLGVGLAVLIGVPLGIAIGLSRWVESALQRVIEFLRPIPVVALIPIAIVMFGIELSMQVFLITLACVWPVLIGTRGGVRAVDPLLVDTARTFGLGRLGTVRRVVLPSSIPAIATSLRVGAGLGVIVAVAAELISGSAGLGQVLISNQRSGNTDVVWACLMVTGAFGIAVNLMMGAFERWVAGWQQHVTEQRR